jgi:hypothetical protein
MSDVAASYICVCVVSSEGRYVDFQNARCNNKVLDEYVEICCITDVERTTETYCILCCATVLSGSSVPLN